uniref:Opioid growth factor receptor (OGFr) conserved domain-containing protein n=1 Tax=Mola mola TaxID=94237 RepID=A0A3Q3WQR3_MOLML
MEDDCVCEYDSTWDTESDGDDPTKTDPWHHTSRNMRAARDMQNYRRGYPVNTLTEHSRHVYIESFLKEWKNDYKRLERVHSYIQWLFPLREPGVNYMASELTKKEIEAFKKSEDAKKRLVYSYELMLGFYGIHLVNKGTGDVKRAENWKERFGNLERNMHNNLRITRILKSMGELGFEHFQAPLVRFFLEETLVKKTLSSVKRSVLDYFLFAVLDKEKRQELVRFAYLHFEPKDKFVWCPRKIQKQFRRAEKRTDAAGNGEGREEAYSQAKIKDGEAVVQQKEDRLDKVTKDQRGTEKATSKFKNKLSESSTEPKPEAETVGNGYAETASANKMLGNGSDSTDDVDEMDQSPSPDTITATQTELCTDKELKLTNNSKASIQEPDIMPTDGDIDTEKPPKKKREDDQVLSSNSSAGESANGQMEEKAGANKAAGLTSSSAQTPLKTSKHSPSPFLGREEKIPRTDFIQVPDKKEDEETSQADVLASDRSMASTDKSVNEQTNGKDSEDVDIESNTSKSDLNMGHS